jgi:hypothetical protein
VEGDLSSYKKETLNPTTLKRRFYALFIGLGIYVIAFAIVQSAQAAPGESTDSITSDRKSLLAAQGATTALNGYTIHTMESDATTVREYISPDGVVFGSAWNGLIQPDLTPLLGTYAGNTRKSCGRPRTN